MARAVNIKIQFGQVNTVVYTNWKGVRAVRRIIPLHLWYGTSPHHPLPCWLLHCVDPDKMAEGGFRDFALDALEEFEAEADGKAQPPPAGRVGFLVCDTTKEFISDYTGDEVHHGCGWTGPESRLEGSGSGATVCPGCGFHGALRALDGSKAGKK